MKRDMDLAREILLQVEQTATVTDWIKLTISDHDSVQVSEHCRLLAEAGLLEVKEIKANDYFEVFPIRLTWYGHEFLANAKDKGTWESAKKLIKEKGAPLTLDIIKTVLASLIQAKFTGLN